MKLLTAVLFGAIAFPAFAGGDRLSNQQLCVAYAQTVLTGKPYTNSTFIFATGTPQDVITAELEKRGEKCEPSEMYLQAAVYQLQERRDRAARHRAMASALNGIANPPQTANPTPAANSPTYTNCRLVGDRVLCTTY